MFRPLSDEEKKQALREGVEATMAEAERRAPELAELQKTAQTIFAAYLPKFSPELRVEQAQMPSQMSAPLFEELWSTKVKPTIAGPK